MKVHINVGANKATGGGMCFWGMLAILFIGLKLTGFITWSWWWVLAPVWIPAVIGLVVVVPFAVIWVRYFLRR